MALRMGRCLLLQRLSEAKITQKELAVALDVSESFISMVISGERHLSLERAVNASVILDCDVRSLYEWHEVKK